jgi:hypothetical protein
LKLWNLTSCVGSCVYVTSKWVLFLCLYHSVSQPECMQCCWLTRGGILPTPLKRQLTSECWRCYVMRCFL